MVDLGNNRRPSTCNTWGPKWSTVLGLGSPYRWSPWVWISSHKIAQVVPIPESAVPNYGIQLRIKSYYVYRSDGIVYMCVGIVFGFVYCTYNLWVFVDCMYGPQMVVRDCYFNIA